MELVTFSHGSENNTWLIPNSTYPIAIPILKANNSFTVSISPKSVSTIIVANVNIEYALNTLISLTAVLFTLPIPSEKFIKIYYLLISVYI